MERTATKLNLPSVVHAMRELFLRPFLDQLVAHVAEVPSLQKLTNQPVQAALLEVLHQNLRSLHVDFAILDIIQIKQAQAFATNVVVDISIYFQGHHLAQLVQ